MPNQSPTASIPLTGPADGHDDYLAALNPQQRTAAEHGAGAGPAVDGRPLLVIAGAGSGKTNTLAHRVAHLVAAGCDPQRVLLLTFSRRAAAEMERRAAQILTRVARRSGHSPPKLSWSGTFHSVGARLLREYAPRIGLHASFTIHDRGDSEDLLAIVRHDLGYSTTQTRFPAKATCLAIYSRVVNSAAPLSDVLATAFPWCGQWEAELRRLFAAYVAAKQAQNVLDFDDLLLYWSHLAADLTLAPEIGGRFDQVLVDEYQDTNRLQEAILLGLKPDGRGLTVVGDDAQSIYSFRAATVRNILDFPQRFRPPARVVTLERNYRSTSSILAASNAVIALAAERYTKNLWTDRASSHQPELLTVQDEAEQARCTALRVLECREAGIALKAQAVLFRSSSHSAQLELELSKRNVPFVKFGGLKFLEAAHIKDVLAVLRWAENPRSRMAGFRVLKLLPGIGPARAAKILDETAAAPDPGAAIAAMAAPRSLDEPWRALVAALQALTQATPGWPAEFDVVTRWYEPHLDRLYDDARIRHADLLQMRQIAATYPSRERFLTELTLDPPQAVSDEAGIPGLDDDYLILSTIHSAKGQEWQSVHILNVVDGCIPSDLSTGTREELEEERRLLYVAMTRAREHLRLMVPQRFYVSGQSGLGDRHVYASRSRFIPDSLLPHFAVSAWPEVDHSNGQRPVVDAGGGPCIDLTARMRAVWR